MKAISKLLALVLVVAMMVTCAACAKTPASSTTPSETPSLFNVDKLPIVNEPVTLRILTCDPVNRPFDTADKAGVWAWLTE